MKRPDFTGIRPDIAEYITFLEQNVEQLGNRVADITQMFQNLQRLYFGKKSERIHIPALMDGAQQLSFFDKEEPAPAPRPVEAETVEVSGHKRRKKRTQEELIAELPVVIHEHTIPQDQRRCPRCGNEELTCIGRELAYVEYVLVPEHMDKHEHYVEKYACHACEDGTEDCKTCDHANEQACSQCPNRPGMVVISAKLPEQYCHPLIKGSKASPSIVAQLYYDKFELAIPEYRQEKEWERLGFPLSRQTMSDWILRVDKDHLRAMTDYMLKIAKQESGVVNCDETPVKVLDEKTANGNPKKCHMWVIRTGKFEKKQLVVYNYRSSRAGNVPTDMLAGYKRYFVSDGYAGYNELGKEAIRCGCWAHLRRKFYDAVPDHNMDLPGAARDGVRFCDKLFRIEERLDRVAPEERKRVRETDSKAVVEQFYSWLDTLQPGNKKLKDAVTYARNQREPLLRFLEDGRIPISNNAAENAIRPFVVGRKNWLFCKSDDGATAAANAYTLVETAKANGLDVLKYLNYVFQRIPMADGHPTDDFIEALMPWNEVVMAECKRGYI